MFTFKNLVLFNLISILLFSCFTERKSLNKIDNIKTIQSFQNVNEKKDTINVQRLTMKKDAYYYSSCYSNCNKIYLDNIFKKTIIFNNDSLCMLSNNQTFLMLYPTDSINTSRRLCDVKIGSFKSSLYVFLLDIIKKEDDILYEYEFYGSGIHSEYSLIIYFSFKKGIVKFSEFFGDKEVIYFLK